MKRLFYSFLFVGLISCSSNNRETFKGFGELQIGTKFDSLHSFRLFEKIEENHYELNKYEISKEIGFIESVNVYLKNDRIIKVNFETGEYTNCHPINKDIIKLKETESSKRFNKNATMLSFREYTTKNKEITLEKKIYSSIDKISISYFNTSEKEKLEHENKVKEDSIKKLEYLRDVKR